MVIGVNGADFEVVPLTHVEQTNAVSEGYLPILLRQLYDPKTIALITTDSCAKVFHNHKHDGSGTNNTVLSSRFDLEFCSSAQWYNGKDCGPNGEIKGSIL